MMLCGLSGCERHEGHSGLHACRPGIQEYLLQTQRAKATLNNAERQRDEFREQLALAHKRLGKYERMMRKVGIVPLQDGAEMRLYRLWIRTRDPVTNKWITVFTGFGAIMALIFSGTILAGLVVLARAL